MGQQLFDLLQNGVGLRLTSLKAIQLALKWVNDCESGRNVYMYMYMKGAICACHNLNMDAYKTDTVGT